MVGTEDTRMTNQEHREKIEECAEALAQAFNEAIADGMIVSVDFDTLRTMGEPEQVIASVSCEPSIDRILFYDQSKGCEACINWTAQKTCRKRVAIQGHAPDYDFKCKWWESGPREYYD